MNKKREPYVVNSVIRSPVSSINRDTILVPRNYKILAIYSNLTVGYLDVKDNNRSIFGKNPLPCFVFDTLEKKFEFPVEVEITTSLDVEVDLTGIQNLPTEIVITFVGVIEKEENRQNNQDKQDNQNN